MKISEIYKNYKILPNLQLHQLRVAAVSKLIVQNISANIDSKEIISACLLHDMGNIIKFDLKRFPEFLEPEGLEYWEKVQHEFITKYSDDEHSAHSKIAQEIGVETRVLELIDSVGFSQSKLLAISTDFSKKIVCYSDQRVGPFGILSLEERFADGATRTPKNKINEDTKQRELFVNESRAGFFKLEKQIFELCSISAENINDESVNSFLEELKSFEIITH